MRFASCFPDLHAQGLVCLLPQGQCMISAVLHDEVISERKLGLWIDGSPNSEFLLRNRTRILQPYLLLALGWYYLVVNLSQLSLKKFPAIEISSEKKKKNRDTSTNQQKNPAIKTTSKIHQ